MDINDYRSNIDKIDREIVELFKKRMDTAKNIAEYKKQNSLPIYDGARERALLTKVSDLAGEEYSQYTRVLFSTVMNLSRSCQIQLTATESSLSKKIKKALETTPNLFPEKATVACQGVEGAYSQLACEKLFAVPNIMFFNSFDGVFKAVNSGLCRYGVLPLENSTAGSVNKVYDLMSRYKFHIVRSIRCRITHELLAKPGTNLSDIKEIISHEQALNQCAQFLADHKDIKITICENTAVAAKTVAESGRTDIAAIASSTSARQYGLKVIASDILDNGGNDTRFICISKEPEIYPGSDRTSIKLILPHRPGSLYNVLARFASLGVNIVKLESRPIPGKDFEFMFYFDIGVSVYSPALAELLCELEQEVDELVYLGSYSEIV
jgi:chorismate mutase/prephenate dehydratase